MKKLNMLKAIGNELRNIRTVKNISLKEVAEEVGVSTMYISEIERDKKSPSDEVIKKLSSIYNVSEAELFEGFHRMPDSISSEVLGFNELFTVLYDLANNPEITIEQREIFYKDVHEKYVTMFKS